MKIFKQQLVACATLLRLSRVKMHPETSKVFGVEVRVVLGEVAVVVIVVADVADPRLE